MRPRASLTTPETNVNSWSSRRRSRRCRSAPWVLPFKRHPPCEHDRYSTYMYICNYKMSLQNPMVMSSQYWCNGEGWWREQHMSWGVLSDNDLMTEISTSRCRCIELQEMNHEVWHHCDACEMSMNVFENHVEWRELYDYPKVFHPSYPFQCISSRNAIRLADEQHFNFHLYIFRHKTIYCFNIFGIQLKVSTS